MKSKFLYADGDEIEILVEKYNPYRDHLGRFSSGGGSAFSNAGGTISEPLTENSSGLKTAQAEMDMMTEAMGDEFAKDKGVEFTRLALNENEIHAKVKVARAEDGIAGAIQYTELPSDMANDMFGFSTNEYLDLPDVTYIAYVGSTGIVDKTGTALVMSVMQDAAKSNTGLLLESADANSTKFWETFGVEQITPSLMYLSPDKVKAKVGK